MNKTSNSQFERALMRPTTKDLARAAGVSRATVDRVLNGREGVKPKTVELVNKAIEDLGFVRNIQAANLARSRSYRIIFALPRSGGEFLAEIMHHIEEAERAFANELIWCEVHQIEENDPHSIAAFLGGLSPDDTSGVAIMAPESPPVRDAVLRLQERGIAALPFISDQTIMAENWVGINNHAAGATAGTLLGRFTKTRGSVLVISESMQARNNLERRLGFDEELRTHFPDLVALPSLETYGEVARAEDIIPATIKRHDDLAGIYILSSEARIPLSILNNLPEAAPLTKIAHERTPCTEDALRNGQLDGIIAQDAGHLVRSAIRKLKALSDKTPAHKAQEKIRIEVLLRTNL